MDIAESYPKREETFSLKTKDYAEAVRLVRRAAVEVDQKFEAHRQAQKRAVDKPLAELSAAQMKQIGDVYYQHVLEEDEEMRIMGFEDPAKGLSLQDLVKLDDSITAQQLAQAIAESQSYPEQSFEGKVNEEEGVARITRAHYARGHADDFHVSEAQDVLSWESVNLKLDPRSPSWRPLVRKLQEASLRAHEAIAQRNQGYIIETPEAPQDAVLVASATPVLSELFEQRKAEAERIGDWSVKLRDDYEGWTQLFIELIGDRPITDYKKPDARLFKDLLLQLPSNREKHNYTKGLSANDAIAAGKKHGVACISVSTINKALGRLQATWKWADKQLDEDVPDIFGPMKLKNTEAARDQKNPFSGDQLRQIFASPLFTGCHSEKRRADPGHTDMRHTHWYWLPLLGLYTGARLNELCQLRVNDVAVQDNIPYIQIHEEGENQRTKGHTKRKVPLHSELIRLGFLQHVANVRSLKQEQVFPAIRYSERGYFSERPSRDFTTYIEKIGAKTDKTSFHSFRHNFKDACRNNGVPPDIADLLQGHSLSGMAGRYGHGQVNLARLAEELCKINYGDVTRHLGDQR